MRSFETSPYLPINTLYGCQTCREASTRYLSPNAKITLNLPKVRTRPVFAQTVTYATL